MQLLCIYKPAIAVAHQLFVEGSNPSTNSLLLTSFKNVLTAAKSNA